MIIGLAKHAVRLVPYQPEWESLFRAEAELLNNVFKDGFLGVEHIGSTAIVGMDAKPIIDIMVAVSNFDNARALVPEIEAVGYEFLPDEPPPDRMLFVKGPSSARTHHLSITEPSSVFWTNMILFRDYLRNHSQVAEEYRALKENLAQKYPTQRPSYTEAKRAFVERVLELSRIELKNDKATDNL